MNDAETDSANLRNIAEAQALRHPLDAAIKGDNLAHELQVHQIELEMQNENLRGAQLALEESRDRYHDLYEFAPAAYLTLSREGLITQMNLTASDLLGVDRHQLLKQRFEHYVSADSKNVWHQHLIRARQSNRKYTCELILNRADQKKRFVHLNSQYQKRDDCLHIALTDITELRQNEEARLLDQAEELRRWHEATSGREGRIIELKHEVNQLLNKLALPPRYSSAEPEE